MPTHRSDPISEWFTDAARQLLTRAYRQRGQWVETRLANPTAEQAARALVQGINIYGADQPSGRAGVLDCKTRWGRAYARALFHQHKWYSGRPGGGWRAMRRTTPRTQGIRVEFGLARPALGVIPAGRVVRVMFTTANSKRAVARTLSDRQRWDIDDQARSAPERRDWAS